MVICPWCGTNYQGFLSNCKKCGGPIPFQEEGAFNEASPAYPPPPASPRPISPNFAWKLMQTDETSIIGLVLAIIGGTFALVGLSLTLPIVTAFVGLPFALIGFLTFGGGVFLISKRYQEKQAVVNVLVWGVCTQGQVTGVHENVTLSINNRHPWVIEYQYSVNGQILTGTVSTLQSPGLRFSPEKPVYVLYLPSEPTRNALYPHP